MAIVGIDALLYGVEDLERSTQFFVDFGLPLQSRSPEESVFRLDEGSTVVLRHIDHASIPEGPYKGYGVNETILGVNDPASFDALVAGLRTDREVTVGDDGAARFVSDCGLALGLRVFERRPVLYAPDPVNAAGNVRRFNQHRRWRERAVPKTINHVVFAVKDYWATFRFFRDRLHFRLSDHQKGIGTYVRPDGAFEHHTMFFLDCNLPGAGGRPGFNHACFGVEDIDEMMVGTHHMLRKGWQTGWMGSGRHRIASALFSYLKCPAGGEAEYGADTDYIDDSWMPREWEYVFGTVMWAHAHEPLMKDEPSWDVGYYRPTGPARTG